METFLNPPFYGESLMYHLKITKRSQLHGAIVTHITGMLVEANTSFHVKSKPEVTHILFPRTPENYEVAEDVRLIYAKHADVTELTESAALVAARAIENSWHAYVTAMTTPGLV